MEQTARAASAHSSDPSYNPMCQSRIRIWSCRILLDSKSRSRRRRWSMALRLPRIESAAHTLLGMDGGAGAFGGGGLAGNEGIKSAKDRFLCRLAIL